MTIQMQNPEEMTLEQMQALVESSRAVRFSIEGREAVYGLLVRVLKKQHYAEQSREQRGIVRRFLVKVSGWSRAQITRLIGQWMQTRTIQAKRPTRRRFPTPLHSRGRCTAGRSRYSAPGTVRAGGEEDFAAGA